MSVFELFKVKLNWCCHLYMKKNCLKLHLLPCLCPFTLRVTFNFSINVLKSESCFWMSTTVQLDKTQLTDSCGMWLNQEKKGWWCGALQPSLISYAACLVSRATSRLQLLSKHENVTLQWVGALPSLKHISSHSPRLFFSFCLSIFLVWLRKELRWSCRECPTITLQRGREGNGTVRGQEAKKRCAVTWDKSNKLQ